MTLRTALAAALCLAASAPTAAGEAVPGMEATVIPVDRFSDAAGTLLRRSADPSLPGPGEPIDLDRPAFVIPVRGPDGKTYRCYDLDVRPARPARLYVFYDPQGNYQLGQFPIVSTVPGEPGYTDLWEAWKVTTPQGFHAERNPVRDLASLERLLADPQSGYRAARSGVLVNLALVPDGSRATMAADARGGSARLDYAWFRGQRVAYLHFEGSVSPEADEAPIANLRVGAPTKAAPPGSLAKDLASGARAAGIEALPHSPGYSPLHRLVDPDGRAILDGLLNCPVVGTGD